ncbi:MAG: hypothetical protein OXG03_01725 [Gammaproteobacteria bacterium]|nr:hypothetical protein [Gammaproteobacteria bacterium]
MTSRSEIAATNTSPSRPRTGSYGRARISASSRSRPVPGNSFHQHRSFCSLSWRVSGVSAGADPIASRSAQEWIFRVSSPATCASSRVFLAATAVCTSVSLPRSSLFCLVLEHCDIGLVVRLHGLRALLGGRRAARQDRELRRLPEQMATRQRKT